MKVGILTLPLNYNYGGILQAYALCSALKAAGHDARLIYKPFSRRDVSLAEKAKRLVKKLLGRYSGYVNYEAKLNSWLPVMTKNVNTFIDKHINRTQPISHYTDLREEDFDAIVVGSDQVWRAGMFQDDIRNAYLAFAENWNIRRVAYAPSFGADRVLYTPSEIEECMRLLKSFDAVSVREKSAIAICKDLFNVDAQLVCDPTLLIDASEYIRLIEVSNTPKHEGRLFTYILDDTPERQQMVDFISAEMHTTAFSVNSFDGNAKCDIERRIAQSVEAWLRGFYDADFIITDSFHACVFSIIFRKPFAVTVNKGRGVSRFSSLLSILGLEDRMIETLDDYKRLPSTINYDDVYGKLDVFRNNSLDYLKTSLDARINHTSSL